MSFKSVEFRDGSLPGFEFGSGGTEASGSLSAVRLRIGSQPV
jgi:hypothetical protein